MNSYYKTLEIPENSSKDSIKKAYHKLAKKYHPDKNKDADSEEKFKKISEAYNALTNENFDNSNDINIPDIFGMFFKSMKPRGNPVIVTINVDLKDIYYGSKHKISYSFNDTLSQPLNLNGIIVQQIHIKKKNVETEINIPSCFDTKEPLILNEQVVYSNGLKGDLIVNIIQNEHPIFKRNGDDLYTTLTITLKEALTEFTREIDMLDSSINVFKSSNIINPNSIKVINGLGMTSKGSLIINFKIEFPESINEKNRNFILENF